MSRLPRHYDADLLAAGALALAAALVTVLPFPDLVRAVLLLPAALLLPGYLVAAVLFVPGSLTQAERVIYVFSFSVVFWALSGLVVQVAIGLDRGVWLALLLILTAVAVPLAQARRGGGARPRRPARPELRKLAPIPIAMAIAAVAIALASSSADSQLDRARFSSVWILPSEATTSAVRVGAENREGTDVEYRLRVSREGVGLSRWRFTLGDRETWQREIYLPPIAGRAPVVVALFRNGRLYRRAALAPEALR